jgi:hypothetical protein
MAKCWIIRWYPKKNYLTSRAQSMIFVQESGCSSDSGMPWKIRIAFCHSRAFSQALIAAPKLTMSGWRSASDLGLLAISYPTLGSVTTCDYCKKNAKSSLITVVTTYIQSDVLNLPFYQYKYSLKSNNNKAGNWLWHGCTCSINHELIQTGRRPSYTQVQVNNL